MANPVTTLPPASRSVVVAGASGLVGRCLVEQLCADPSVSVVHALVRRPLTETHPKLQVHVVDFTALPALPPVDEVYLSLGTTIKIAGSQEAFRAVDFDANLAFTRSVGEAFLEVYPRIVRRRMNDPFDAADVAAQRNWRGRYAEFNLVYDRGTLFGLKTGGNIDAILMSLPPLATWE